jgi:hypothetical protein
MKIHPVQTIDNKGGFLRTDVTLAAYEVYCHVFAPQPALIADNCRGGFSTGELVAFLYARSFPKDEWKKRVNEAFEGMEHI